MSTTLAPPEPATATMPQLTAAARWVWSGDAVKWPAAVTLYDLPPAVAALRAGDEKGLQTVVVAQPQGDGIAIAIRDRLKRAAHSGSQN